MSRVLKVLDEILYKYEGIQPQGFDEGGLATPKRGLVDEPGSYSQTKPHNYFNRGIKVSETLDGKKSYYAKVKVGDEIKSFSDSSLEKVKKWKRKTSEAALKKGYEKRDMSYAAEQTKKQRAKEAKITAKARANIDKWTKNWLDKNLKNYGVRELGLFKKDLVKAWTKELKKNPNPYIGKSDFKPTAYFERTMTMKDLPNLTGSSISDKPFKYGNRILGDKLNIETLFNKIFYDTKLKDKNFKNKVKDFMQHYVDGAPHGNNVVARNAYDSKTAKLLDDDVLYFLSRDDSKLDGATRKAVMETAFGDLWSNYRDTTDKLGAAYRKNSKLIDEFLGGKNILHKASVKEHDALRKIFNVSKLPDALTYNIDHMYGISEAVREINSANPSKARVRAIVNNTLGMTKKRNMKLGLDGYSFKRKNLVNQINAGKNVDANLIKLNEATKAAYNIDNAYEIKQGKVTPGKSFVGRTQPERFKMYFEDIYKTKPGKREIIRQHGSLKNLLAKLCPGNASGGRVGMKVAGTPGVSCGQDRLKQIMNGSKPKPNEMSLIKRIMGGAGGVMKNMANPKQFLSLRALLGPEAIAFLGAFEAGVIGYENLAKGVPIKEALGENWATSWAVPWSVQGAQIEDMRKKGMINTDALKKWAGGQEKIEEIDNLYQNLNTFDSISGQLPPAEKAKAREKMEATIKEKENEFISWMEDNEIRMQALLPGSAGEEEFQKTLMERDAIARGKAPLKGLRGDVGAEKLPPIYQRFGPRGLGVKKEKRPIDRIRYDLPQTAADFKYEEQDLPDYARQEWENIFTDVGMLRPRESLSDVIDATGRTGMEYAKDQYNIGEKWRQLFQLPGIRGSQDWRGANGGIATLNPRRPHAIPPESGPMPQGGGLSSMFNRVRKW